MDQKLPTPEDSASIERSATNKALCTSENRYDMDQEAARTVGKRLAQLREAKDWKIDDISGHLKVPVMRLQALEAGELDSLPGMTFVIGMVRSYAKILGADPAPFVDELRQARRVPEPHLALPESYGVKLPRNHRPLAWTARLQRRWWGWAGVFALMCVFFVVLFRQYGTLTHWFVQRKEQVLGAYTADERSSIQALDSQMQPPAASEMEQHEQYGEREAMPDKSLESAPAATEISSEEINAPDMQSLQGSKPESEVATPNAQPSIQPATSMQPSEENSQSTVHFNVSQTTWVSVRQKDGQKIYTGLLSAGDTLNVQGILPFQVIVGNALGLESLELNGQPVEPSKYQHTKDNVARFSLP